MRQNKSNQVQIGNFYSFTFKSQNFAQVVEHFAQTFVCVSAAFRNSAQTFLIYSSFSAVSDSYFPSLEANYEDDL